MADLSAKKCVPCERGVLPFNQTQISQYLVQLKTPWDVIETKKIKKQFKFKNFRESIGFINKVADIAEHEGHHPDIHVFYNKVTIDLWTHAIGGLSENDFIMASKIEQLLFK